MQTQIKPSSFRSASFIPAALAAVLTLALAPATRAHPSADSRQCGFAIPASRLRQLHFRIGPRQFDSERLGARGRNRAGLGLNYLPGPLTARATA